MATNDKEVQRKADAKRAGSRARAWTAIVYPDSAVKDWRSILADSLVEALISPLHDRDILPTGEPKKAHYHVVLSFKNPCGRDKAKEIFERIGAVMPPIQSGHDAAKVADYRQMARYLCHMDQPDKARYSIDDVETIGGLDYRAIVMTASDEDDVLDEIERFIESHRIVSFTSFCRYVRNCKPEWRYFVRHKFSYYIREFIKAHQWELDHLDLIAHTEQWGGAVANATDYDTPPQSSKFQESCMTDDGTVFDPSTGEVLG